MTKRLSALLPALPLLLALAAAGPVSAQGSASFGGSAEPPASEPAPAGPSPEELAASSWSLDFGRYASVLDRPYFWALSPVIGAKGSLTYLCELGPERSSLSLWIRLDPEQQPEAQEEMANVPLIKDAEGARLMVDGTPVDGFSTRSWNTQFAAFVIDQPKPIIERLFSGERITLEGKSGATLLDVPLRAADAGYKLESLYYRCAEFGAE